MKRRAFKELLESVRQGAEIIKGKTRPSREFHRREPRAVVKGSAEARRR